MKKLFLSIIVLFLFACSTEDSPTIMTETYVHVFYHPDNPDEVWVSDSKVRVEGKLLTNKEEYSANVSANSSSLKVIFDAEEGFDGLDFVQYIKETPEEKVPWTLNENEEWTLFLDEEKFTLPGLDGYYQFVVMRYEL